MFRRLSGGGGLVLLRGLPIVGCWKYMRTNPKDSFVQGEEHERNGSKKTHLTF